MAADDVLLDSRLTALLAPLTERLAGGFEVPPYRPSAFDEARAATVLGAVADRLHDNYPYFHPLYAGQMLKPPHPVARVAYALASAINPNNHALDGGRATSAMEKEAVAELLRVFGLGGGMGHLCGGGTMANLEALWVCGRLRPGEKIVSSAQAHYTHERICGVLDIPYEPVPVDDAGRLEVDALRAALERGGVGAVVATMGTTATGSVDPLDRILPLARAHGSRVHADAAYGGYFALVDGVRAETRAAFDALPQVDSLVVDPHKHGLQPYGCGCVLFADPAVGALYRHESPYTYFTSGALHLGEISLECSRPGAAAAALWATQQLLPLERGGAFAAGLESGLRAARALYDRLRGDERFVVAFAPELDIVVWTVAGADCVESSQRAREVFEAAERRGLYLALAELPVAFFAGRVPGDPNDRVTALRSVLMKPEHEAWIDEIYARLSASTAQ